MTVTVTDLFCGAGGSSLGVTAAGGELIMAANHWKTAIDVHQAHFPEAAHDLADISQADPRRYPVTDLLLASPECTNHSQARGVSRRQQDPTVWDAPDPAAERSRATMWDVVRFGEQMKYKAIIVENVVEATKWILWPAFIKALTDLGYTYRILSHNSMHHGVAQSRDRMFLVAWLGDLNPDLEFESSAWCAHCERDVVTRQTWRPERAVGRYRRQWNWTCVTCANVVDPTCTPASTIIDWLLPCPRIGDRARPLADKTRARILAGLEKYGWVCASDDRLSLVVPMRNHGDAYTPGDNPLGTVTAGGNHHGLLMRNNSGGAEMVTPVSEPARTMTTAGHQSLLVPDLDPEPDYERIIDECGFRMLEPHEVAAAMAFPAGYIPLNLPKKDRVKLAGNAVTPPCMEWIAGRVIQALEAKV